MRRRTRTDRNHAEIADALRAVGWDVTNTAHVGYGFPDMIANKPDRIAFIEVKDGNKAPSARVLTDQEVQMHGWLKKAGIEVKVLTSVEEAVSL